MVSVVIPMYRSEQTIDAVVGEVRAALDPLRDYAYEIILVNDCSPDHVLEKALALADADARIRVIDLARNAGQPNAMVTGYRYASGDYIVSMDDDLQHPAGAIPKMLDALAERDLDVVFAQYDAPKENAFRRFGSRVNQMTAQRLAGKPAGIESNSFYVIRRFVRDAILRYEGGNPYVFGIIFASTSHIGNVHVEHRARAVGKSGFTFFKLLAFWLNGFIGFSIKPLRVATAIGFLISAVSAVIALVLFIQRLLHPDVGMAGWTSLVLVIIFFSGVQLICLGVLGEYLGKLYLTQSRVPTASVRNTKNVDAPEND